MRCLALVNADISEIQCSHNDIGLPLMVSVFNPPEDGKTIFEVYARKVIEGIQDIFIKFPEIDLHDRLAIIVPDDHFPLKSFSNKLSEHFERENYKVTLIPAEEASRSLNLRKDGDSCIVLDTVSEVRGLEYLFVFGVGLDQLNKDGNKKSLLDLSRSQIYCAMTRCQLHFTLINEFIKACLSGCKMWRSQKKSFHSMMK